MSGLRLLLASSALVAGLGLAGIAAASPALLHSYDLNGSLADGQGGPALSQGGGGLGPSGWVFSPGDYLELTTPGLTSSAAYSIEMEFQFNNQPASWYRTINTSPGAANDNGAYIYQDRVAYYEGSNQTGGLFSAGAQHHYVFSRDITGIYIYLDGALSLNLPAFGSSLAAGPIWLFRDDASENGPGFIDYARFYDGALSASDVATLYDGGSLNGVPEPTSWALMLVGFGGLGAALRRRRSLRAVFS